MFALFLELRVRTRPQDLWPFLILETGLKFLIWAQGEIGPDNRAHAKSPSETLKSSVECAWTTHTVNPLAVCII